MDGPTHPWKCNQGPQVTENKLTAAPLGGRGNCRLEELRQVEAGANECPLTLYGTKSPAHESKKAEVPLDLSEDRLHALAPQLVSLTTFLGHELPLHPVPCGRILWNPPLGGPCSLQAFLCLWSFLVAITSSGPSFSIACTSRSSRHYPVSAANAPMGSWICASSTVRLVSSIMGSSWCRSFSSWVTAAQMMI